MRPPLLPTHIINTFAWILVVGVLYYLLFYSRKEQGTLVQPGSTQQVENDNILQGSVIEMFHNPHLDIDGFSVRSNNNTVTTFHFPPHTASAVMGIAKPGDEVIIGYRSGRMAHKGNMIRFNSIQNIKTQKQVFIDNIPHPILSGASEDKLFQITNPVFKTNEEGYIVAIVDSQYIFHIKPHIAKALHQEIKLAKSIAIRGFVRNKDEGFVNILALQSVECINIEIDGKTYLTQ